MITFDWAAKHRQNHQLNMQARQHAHNNRFQKRGSDLAVDRMDVGQQHSLDRISFGADEQIRQSKGITSGRIANIEDARRRGLGDADISRIFGLTPAGGGHGGAAATDFKALEASLLSNPSFYEPNVVSGKSGFDTWQNNRDYVRSIFEGGTTTTPATATGNPLVEPGPTPAAAPAAAPVAQLDPQAPPVSSPAQTPAPSGYPGAMNSDIGTGAPPPPQAPQIPTTSIFDAEIVGGEANALQGLMVAFGKSDNPALFVDPATGLPTPAFYQDAANKGVRADKLEAAVRWVTTGRQ